MFCESILSSLTRLDAASWQGCRQLLRNGANTIGGKGVLARCQHPHDKLKQAGGDAQVLIKEDTSQEWLEESIDDGIAESLFLQAGDVLIMVFANAAAK